MKKITQDQLSIYIPQDLMQEEIIPRLIKVAKEQERSVNYVALKAIREYLDRMDGKTGDD